MDLIHGTDTTWPLSVQRDYVNVEYDFDPEGEGLLHLPRGIHADVPEPAHGVCVPNNGTFFVDTDSDTDWTSSSRTRDYGQWAPAQRIGLRYQHSQPGVRGKRLGR